MKNKLLMAVAILFASANIIAQSKINYFPKENLTTIGAYYYPEHWDESQWDRDLKKMSELGFEFTHFGEFAWAQLEPEKGKYDFVWLDNALELAAKYNLKVILCTSTATPPVWLTRSHPEILIKNEDGTTMEHGARQHATFSNTFYRQYSLKMIAELGKRYGNDSRVIGWQLDNEPKVRRDFNMDALNRFRTFLKKKYNNDISQLNKAWGTAFWSQIYNNFEMIHFPLPSTRTHNPHQILDWQRFCAYETNSFLDEQAIELRKYCKKDQWITTNYIPSYNEGHIGKSHQLDFCSYTRYMVSGGSGIDSLGFRIGDPLSIPFANDFFRPLSSTYGVMELQPGQVNWGSLNTQPYPGAVRLWLWSVFAGGSDFTCTYRFRQPLYGYEQFHQAIITPDGVTTSKGGQEFVKFINEINQLRKLYNPTKTALPTEYMKRKAAILFNYENTWSINRSPLTNKWNSQNHIEKYYKALKSFGAPVDVIYEGKDWSGYPILIAPAYEMVDDSLITAWTDYVKKGGHLILTCRTGMKDRMSHLFEMPLSGKIFPLIGGKLDFYDLLPDNRGKVQMNGKEYDWSIWGDILIPDKGTEVWANYNSEFYAGSPAVLHHKLGKGTVTYVGVETENGTLEKDILKRIYSLSNTKLLDLPEGVWMDCRDGFGIALNYTGKDYRFPLPNGAKRLIGEEILKPAEVLVWQY